MTEQEVGYLTRAVEDMAASIARLHVKLKELPCVQCRARMKLHTAQFALLWLAWGILLTVQLVMFDKLFTLLSGLMKGTP